MTLVKRTNGSWLPFFDDFFSRELFNWSNNNFSSTSTTVPAVNIRENDHNFEVEVAAPGMEKKDFKITLEGNTLTISSSRENQYTQEDDRYTRKEFSYQSFQRSFELPKDVVDQNHIEAKYENGLLKLVIPKTESARKKAPRLIEIQ
ncbi:HSP20 family protein [Chitinophaga terrae (ex Kim and Jung 2007)]|uniref:HSP20 family protein n=1 Tax=Chitinophaga terrae (ex Kim and Jung 2007) TaxID=408074 RepID=A0A1H4FFG2_9BACT|nr:Hsp20/alpha crystallin family protein [Chitinophaga terrae (ex Kim and Jung 2007)]GEP92374.1 heat-shock protein [Chitinophaga terrae (ex Kim and Jung 2007)]SEA95911.1 HSP20 family protein [Chitinophaga terrae (ex Kim and Jung 2007)]